MFSLASSRRRSLTSGDDPAGVWCLGASVLISSPPEVLQGTFADVDRIERANSFKACCRSFVYIGKERQQALKELALSMRSTSGRLLIRTDAPKHQTTARYLCSSRRRS